jgi:hypothetical protein
MALSISLLSISKDGKLITIQDSSTPGSTSASIQWRYWTDLAFKPAVVLSGAQLTALKSVGGLGLTPDLVGLTPVVGQAFTDGIHVAQVTVDSGVWTYYILVNKAAEACIVAAIGQLSDHQTDCPILEKHLEKLIRWRFAADVKRDLTDYDGAHNLIVAVGKYCGSTDCNC